MDFSKAERLAALLDGNVSEQEREALLAQLASDDDDLEALSVAAAALGEYEREERESGVVPIGSAKSSTNPAAQPRKRPPRWVALAAAAGIAALVAIPLLRGREEGEPPGPAAVVAQMSDADRALPAGFGLPPTGTTRSGGARPLQDPEAVTLGALLVTLQLAAPAHDSLARVAAGEIAELLNDRPGVGTLARSYRDIATQGLAGRTLDPALGNETAGFGGKAAVAGMWLVAAQVAAAHQDARFFDTPLARRILDGDEEGERLKLTSPVILQRVETQVEGRAPGWPAVQDDLRSLLRAAT
jgi:hypothetical protein